MRITFLFVFLITLIPFCSMAQMESIFLGVESGTGAKAPKASVRGVGAMYDKNLSQNQLMVSVPVSGDEYGQWSSSVYLNRYHFSVDEKLPKDQVEVPAELSNLQFGLSYRQKLEEQKYWMLSAQVGSASDQVFSQSDVDTVNINAVYAGDVKPEESWIWLVNYSNNRPILNNLPLPGFAYVYTPNPKFRGIFGFPFLFTKWNFAENWNLNFSILGFTAVKTELSYQVFGPVQAYVVYDHNQQGFFRRDRSESDKRFFYDEKKMAIGIRSPLNALLFSDLQVGKSWDRHLFEAQSVAKQGENRLFLDAAWYAQFSLAARF